MSLRTRIINLAVATPFIAGGSYVGYDVSKTIYGDRQPIMTCYITAVSILTSPVSIPCYLVWKSGKLN